MKKIENVKTFKFDVKFTDVEVVNPLFSRCKVQVMYTGLNRNGSFMSKETVENALPSIFNIPIIGEFIESKEDFGSHGGKIEISDQGIKYVVTTKPYGVVPESATTSWEEIDGHEYLVVDGCYLWTGRYEEAQDVVDNGKAQSMEIEIFESSFRKDKVLEITDFAFSALCILGDDVEPCFEDANVTGYSLNEANFQEQFMHMIKELKFAMGKEEFKTENPKHFDDNKDDDKKEIKIDNSKDAANTSGSWGDVDKTELRNELLDANNASELVKEGYLIVDDGWEDSPSESLHYPHHVVSDGTLVVHEKGLFAAHQRLAESDPDKKLKGAWDHLERHYKELDLDMSNFSQFSLTSEQLEDELGRILSNEDVTVDPFWGWTCSRYWYVDNMTDEGLVIAYDSENGYLVGFEFTTSEDLVTVNFDTGKRYKVQYVEMSINGMPDGDEAVTNGSDDDDFAFVPKELFEMNRANLHQLMIEEGIKDEFSTNEAGEQVESTVTISDALKSVSGYRKNIEELTEKISSFESEVQELSELRDYKMNKETEEKEVSVKNLFESFVGKLEDGELNSVRERMNELTIEQAESELFALLGKKALSQYSVPEPKSTNKIPVFDDNPIVVKSDKPYAGLIEKYTSK